MGTEERNEGSRCPDSRTDVEGGGGIDPNIALERKEGKGRVRAGVVGLLCSLTSRGFFKVVRDSTRSRSLNGAKLTHFILLGGKQERLTSFFFSPSLAVFKRNITLSSGRVGKLWLGDQPLCTQI